MAVPSGVCRDPRMRCPSDRGRRSGPRAAGRRSRGESRHRRRRRRRRRGSRQPSRRCRRSPTTVVGPPRRTSRPSIRVPGLAAASVRNASRSLSLTSLRAACWAICPRIWPPLASIRSATPWRASGERARIAAATSRPVVAAWRSAGRRQLDRHSVLDLLPRGRAQPVRRAAARRSRLRPVARRRLPTAGLAGRGQGRQVAGLSRRGGADRRARGRPGRGPVRGRAGALTPHGAGCRLRLAAGHAPRGRRAPLAGAEVLADRDQVGRAPASAQPGRHGLRDRGVSAPRDEVAGGPPGEAARRGCADHRHPRQRPRQRDRQPQQRERHQRHARARRRSCPRP